MANFDTPADRGLELAPLHRPADDHQPYRQAIDSGYVKYSGALLLFYPLRRESRWLKDHDKLPRAAEPLMNGSEEVRGAERGSNELNNDE